MLSVIILMTRVSIELTPVPCSPNLVTLFNISHHVTVFIVCLFLQFLCPWKQKVICLSLSVLFVFTWYKSVKQCGYELPFDLVMQTVAFQLTLGRSKRQLVTNGDGPELLVCVVNIDPCSTRWQRSRSYTLNGHWLGSSATELTAVYLPSP